MSMIVNKLTVGALFTIVVGMPMANMAKTGCYQFVSMASPRKGPNPWLLVALSLSSFAAFYSVVKHKERINPASSQGRQFDHPLVPPHQKDPNNTRS